MSVTYPFRFSFLYDDDWHVIEVKGRAGKSDEYPANILSSDVVIDNWIQAGDERIPFNPKALDDPDEWNLELEKEYERYVKEKTGKEESDAKLPTKYIRIFKGYHGEEYPIFVSNKYCDVTCDGFYLNVTCPLCQGRMVPMDDVDIPGVPRKSWFWMCDSCNHMEFDTKTDLSDFKPSSFKFHPEVKKALIKDGKWAPHTDDFNVEELKKSCEAQWDISNNVVDDIDTRLKKIQETLDWIVEKLK